MTAEHRIRNFYGFEFPDDFFRFREFIAGLPSGVLRDACDMSLAFPFDLADGKLPSRFPDHPHWEDRYYHDLPEFVTLFTGTTDGLHYGYFFDAPGELPPVVVHYWHSDTFEHTIDGDTLFEATRWLLEKVQSDFLADEPGQTDYCRERLDQVETVRTRLSAFWGAEREQTGQEYLSEFQGSSWRKPVAKTWDGLGIVVPPATFTKLTSNPWAGYQADPQRLQVEQLVAEAMRELRAGRPGAALQLGRNLWVWARDFPECYSLLDAAYSALGREPLRRLMSEARSWREHCDKPKR
jgi:hypothetical protein